MTYEFLQHYWWLLVSVLGALLVFLMFVQGANSLLFSLARDEEERELIVEATGKKWELTFTTLVTFGGAFFASFPLFYSTSFGGAYWLWMIILFTFVAQAVSYEFRGKLGNLLGRKVYNVFLVVNGVVAPLLVGGAVATFFTGSNFVVDKSNIMGGGIISGWANGWHGLDALADPWNLVLGLAVLFLARLLGTLYVINNVRDRNLDFVARCRRHLLFDFVPFLVLLLVFLVYLLFTEGYACDVQTGVVTLVAGKYLANLLAMPVVLAVLLLGAVGIVAGLLVSLPGRSSINGIWFAGIGAVLAVIALFLVAGYNGTAYYPSNADLQSSLSIANSCSSEFTLRTMSYVSLIIPFVIGYIWYVWKKIW